MSELSVYELETQHGELLPARETLATIFASPVVNISTNVAVAVSAANINIGRNAGTTTAIAQSLQVIRVS
jgi:hypothetical protein